MRRIDWQTPAAILEKIIEYEAVHEIRGWDDLRRRLDPKDRRCFAFFHPALVDEPLIFVEVALMRDMPDAISTVLDGRRDDEDAAPTTAVFYSISNCQEGLKGISFGNFLLKQVAEDLVRDTPSLKTFVTLSPAPSFARWVGSGACERERRSRQPLNSARHWPGCAIRAGSRTRRKMRHGSEELKSAPAGAGGALFPGRPVERTTGPSIRWPAFISATAPGSNG